MACHDAYWYLLFRFIGVVVGILLAFYGKKVSFQVNFALQKEVGVQADRTNYHGLTCDGLKDELRYRGMKVGGIREDLLRRAASWND